MIAVLVAAGVLGYAAVMLFALALAKAAAGADPEAQLWREARTARRQMDRRAYASGAWSGPERRRGVERRRSLRLPGALPS